MNISIQPQDSTQNLNPVNQNEVQTQTSDTKTSKDTSTTPTPSFPSSQPDAKKLKSKKFTLESSFSSLSQIFKTKNLEHEQKTQMEIAPPILTSTSPEEKVSSLQESISLPLSTIKDLKSKKFTFDSLNKGSLSKFLASSSQDKLSNELIEKETEAEVSIPQSVSLEEIEVSSSEIKELHPNENESVEEWVKRICDKYKITNSNFGGITIPLHDFPAKKFHYYCHLQKEIAKIISEEALRPTIDLRLRGDEVDPNTFTFGILGGVGPLSDAEILDKVMTKIQNEESNQFEKIKIDLYSSPPPRTKIQKARRGFTYLVKLNSFLSRDQISNYCVTSNTAHANFPKLQSFSKNKMISLVERVIDTIANDPTENKNVLVLGTKEAYDKQLYPTVLENRKLESEIVSEENSVEIQNWINAAKGGKQLDQVAQNLLILIQEHIISAETNQKPLTHILLGCTELPMIINNLSPEGQEIYRKIQGKIKFVDTEEVFAENIKKELVDANNRAIH